ncbi:UNVERIFIED_CONTAM: hypothetical protein PYX00_010697 [Menopon gallinae]
MMLQKHMGKAVSRMVKDFKQKELIPLKILFFVQATTIAVLYPYLTLHMRELGISIEETAIMSAMIPVIGIIMPPLAGMVADKIGNFKIMLSILSTVGGLTAVLLLVVPPAKTRIQHPEEMVLDFGCVDLGYLNIRVADGIHCSRLPENHTWHDIHTRLETCGLSCQATNQSTGFTSVQLLDDETGILDAILGAKSYSVRIEKNNELRSFVYNLTGEIQTGDAKDYSQSIRRISGDSYFFPFDEWYRLNCQKMSEEEAASTTDFLLSTRIKRQAKERSMCYIGEGGDDIRWDDVPTGTILEDEMFRNRTVTLHYRNNETDPVSNFDHAKCRNFHREGEEITVSVYLDGRANDALELSECEPRCLMTTKRKEICSNMKEDVVNDPTLTFWVYFVVRVLIGITGSTTYSMFEVAVIAILREHKADYGLQRIYSTIGSMVASPLSGFLIDYASRGSGGTDYSPAFYLYCGLKILSSLLILLINLEFKKAAKSVIADFIHVMKNAEVLSLMASCFVLGSAWGYIESFLFWLLEDLGGNRSLMGITVTVGGLAGIPLLILSGPIINKIGHANVIFIGFIFYAIRLLGYSLIYDPYDCLYFEAMESITSSLAITAAITYAAKLSTTTTDGSIQGLIGGLYYGVGKGAGTLVGGYLMKSYGMRNTFQIFAVFTISTGIVYFLISHCYIRKLPKREDNDICKKEPPKPENIAVVTKKEKDTEAKQEPEKTEPSKEEHQNEGYVPTEESQSEDSQSTKTKEE